MESSGEEWQVVKPKKQRKKKEEKPDQGPSPKAKSAETKSKAKGGKEKSRSQSPSPKPQPSKKSGEQQKAKKSEQKKASVMKMPLNTKEQMAFFIKELVMNTPPPSNKLSIAAIGEKIVAVTKHSWSKKFKSSFGSLRGFVENQAELFTVIGDDVYLAGTVRPPSPSKSSTGASPTAKTGPSKKRQPVKQEIPVKALARTQKKANKAHQAVSNEEHGIGCLKALAVIGLIGAVILFTLASVNVIDLKSLQKLAQKKFSSKR